MILTVTLSPSLDLFYDVPAAPVAGEVSRAQGLRIEVGGKGINASRTIRGLGGETLAMLVAGDWTGDQLVGELQRERLPLEVVRSRARTRMNTHIRDSEGTEWKVNEPPTLLQPEEIESLGAQVVRVSEPARAVVIAGSIPKESIPLVQSLAKLFSEKGVLVWADTSGDALKALHGLPLACIKVNKIEFEGAAGSMEAVTEWLDAGAQSICITDGSNPVLLARRGQPWLQATPIAVSSPRRGQSLGAGDAFLGGLAWAHCESLPDVGALRIACACGATRAVSSAWGLLTREAIETVARDVVVTNHEGQIP